MHRDADGKRQYRSDRVSFTASPPLQLEEALNRLGPRPAEHAPRACMASTSADDTFKSKVPQFDGTRSAYHAWAIAMGGYVAFKLPGAAKIFDGTEGPPAALAPAPAPS